MMSKIFPLVLGWRIPSNVLADSFAEMKKDGLRGNEGIVFWLGRNNSGQAEVTHLVSLRGKGVSRGPVNIRIDSSVINDVTDVAMELDVVLIGQIHSHGHGFGTDLSYSDRNYGFAISDYLSIVAPDYALKKSTSLSRCGIFVFDRHYGYRPIGKIEIKQRIKVVPGFNPAKLIIRK
jgi:proteasome lid subunit RPN8/RPN11